MHGGSWLAQVNVFIFVQVSMAAGKAGAVQQRQQEREAAAQKRAAAKVRAEKRAAVAAEQKADRGVQIAMMPMLGVLHSRLHTWQIRSQHNHICTSLQPDFA